MAVQFNDRIWSPDKGLGNSIDECIMLCRVSSKNNSELECIRFCASRGITKGGNVNFGTKTMPAQNLTGYTGLSGIVKNPQFRKLDPYDCYWRTMGASGVTDPLSSDAKEIYNWCYGGRLVGGNQSGGGVGGSSVSRSSAMVAPRNVGMSGINVTVGNMLIFGAVGALVGALYSRDTKGAVIGAAVGAGAGWAGQNINM